MGITAITKARPTQWRRFMVGNKKDDATSRGPMAIPFTVAKGAAIVQRDDGLFEIGHAEGAAGPFETREFAEAVARRMAA
jgi:hypothetical protein